MTKQEEVLQVYRALAEWYENHGQPQMRDRFLVLAADAALTANQAPLAERLRKRLLQRSAQHFLRPYNSMAEAVQTQDVQSYLRSLKQNYPLDAALDLLRTLHEQAAESPETQIGNGAAREDLDSAPQIDLEKTEPLDAPRPTIWQRPQPATPKANNAAASVSPRPATRMEPGKTPPDAERGHRAPVLPPRLAPPAKAKRVAPIKRQSSPETGETGGWLSICLFVIVGATGVAFAVYVFVRPFLAN